MRPRRGEGQAKNGNSGWSLREIVPENIRQCIARRAWLPCKKRGTRQSRGGGCFVSHGWPQGEGVLNQYEGDFGKTERLTVIADIDSRQDFIECQREIFR